MILPHIPIPVIAVLVIGDGKHLNQITTDH
jgi:hypothetical protein